MLLEKIKKTPVEKVFLLISLVFGFLYMFILPPFQSVDEASHFFRGYEIASGKFLAQKIGENTGDYLPVSLSKLESDYTFLIKNIDNKLNVNYIFDSSRLKLNKQDESFIDFKNSALYSPVTYLGQVPGMFVAKSFNLNPLSIFYFGRISNLLVFTLIVYFAIKTTPFYKFPMAILALMPMTLSLAGSLTSDVMVMGLNFLWVALLLKFLSAKDKISGGQILALIVTAVVLALSKSYFMLIPLIFLLTPNRFKNIKNYFLCIFSVLFFSVAGILLWHIAVNGIYSDLNPMADFKGQIQFILAHPFAYFLVFLKSLVIKTPRIIITMIGVLGWQDTRLDFITYILYPILIILAVMLEPKTEFKFKNWQLVLINFDVFFSVGIIFASMYIMWSSLASPIIFGLNGKYFTPLVLPFLLIFYNKSKEFFIAEDREKFKLLIFIAVILILISSDLSLIHRFYGLTPNLYYKV